MNIMKKGLYFKSFFISSTLMIILFFSSCVKGVDNEEHRLDNIYAPVLKNGILTFSMSSFSGTNYRVFPDRYIEDGTAIAECNDAFNFDGLSSYTILDFNENMGRLVAITRTGGLEYMFSANNYMEFVGYSGVQADYFECWCEKDPANTVIRF